MAQGGERRGCRRLLHACSRQTALQRTASPRLRLEVRPTWGCRAAAGSRRLHTRPLLCPPPAPQMTWTLRTGSSAPRHGSERRPLGCPTTAGATLLFYLERPGPPVAPAGPTDVAPSAQAGTPSDGMPASGGDAAAAPPCSQEPGRWQQHLKQRQRARPPGAWRIALGCGADDAPRADGCPGPHARGLALVYSRRALKGPGEPWRLEARPLAEARGPEDGRVWECPVVAALGSDPASGDASSGDSTGSGDARRVSDSGGELGGAPRAGAAARAAVSAAAATAAAPSGPPTHLLSASVGSSPALGWLGWYREGRFEFYPAGQQPTAAPQSAPPNGSVPRCRLVAGGKGPSSGAAPAGGPFPLDLGDLLYAPNVLRDEAKVFASSPAVVVLTHAQRAPSLIRAAWFFWACQQAAGPPSGRHAPMGPYPVGTPTRRLLDSIPAAAPLPPLPGAHLPVGLAQRAAQPRSPLAAAIGSWWRRGRHWRCRRHKHQQQHWWWHQQREWYQQRQW
jgi:hypothetical protein